MDELPSIPGLLNRFRQRVLGADTDSFLFECRRCGTSFYRPRQHCPECGAAEIARFDL